MIHLTDATKVNKVDIAFGELIKDYIVEGKPSTADKVLKCFQTLGVDSKVRLYDLLSK